METAILPIGQIRTRIGSWSAAALAAAAIAGPIAAPGAFAGASSSGLDLRVRLEVIDSVSVDIRGQSDPSPRVLRIDGPDAGEATYIVLDG